jgi:hypothetical protein
MADTPKSVYVVAREIAVRLERAGENPHSDSLSVFGSGRWPRSWRESIRKHILNLATIYL